MRRFRNPVLPGCHPDPSVCRVGDDFYLVTSTFEWFPGLPVHHSRDLVHWRLAGHAFDRPEQLPLDGVPASGGLYAPTLRHHDGTFYLVCTLVDGPEWSGHFVMTARDPAGPWSDPVRLEGDGIDPSLFFDDDGRAWCTGTRPTGRYAGHTEIWLREFDPESLSLTGEEHVIWDGALKGAIWSEGSHLYRVGGRYYLLTAEGGTAMDHAVMVARADRVTGPYEGSPRNPVLTHRHLGAGHPIVGVGHADLVETPDGEWWMVLLAMRPHHDDRCALGRETFLAPLTWEDGWPVAAGRVEAEDRAPSLPEHRWPAVPACDRFDGPELDPSWVMLRTPRERWWSLTDRPGRLRLRLRPDGLDGAGNPSFVGRRQQHREFAAFTALDFAGGDGEEAGLALMQNGDFHVVLAVTDRGLRLAKRERGVTTVLAEAPARPGGVGLGFEAHGRWYQASYARRPGEWTPLGDPIDGDLLTSQVAGGFTGVLVGLYATSNGRPGTNHADFAWFEYAPL
ncbi:glycoside hydrolase family 43 protein [Actinomadura logoneensis]|uniref:Glycoside hydrolase family 43 protein n=1 Tax=Actinomadura logoneensis TaxID=2293572 RepID=A0A372JFE5_9ACTN|nr:glycoside hydrolase family 43 protein [Actinomadura logoneensis]RFU38731.1 glycoside hydrolase family 43 protein [Actinomadura logoneensis]